jgi:hypothetical protein
MFSRAYGTDSTEPTFPSNELLGYYQLSLRDKERKMEKLVDLRREFPIIFFS